MFCVFGFILDRFSNPSHQMAHSKTLIYETECINIEVCYAEFEILVHVCY